MQRRTIHIQGRGNYLIAEWNGRNESNLDVVGERVLIMPDMPDDQTAGGVHLPDEIKEQLAHGAMTGTIVAVGDEAWKWNNSRTQRYEGEPPKIGQRVVFEPHAGVIYPGEDGRLYRLMDDHCVGAVFREETAA